MAAHSLKSISAEFGATQLTELARVGDDGKAGEMSAAYALFIRVEQAYTRVVLALEKWQEKLG
jgi:hypothetical protein